MLFPLRSALQLHLLLFAVTVVATTLVARVAAFVLVGPSSLESILSRARDHQGWGGAKGRPGLDHSRSCNSCNSCARESVDRKVRSSLRSSWAELGGRRRSGRWREWAPRQKGARGRGRGGVALGCGVIAISLADPTSTVAAELYDGLTLLQHRGQDSAGMATSDHSRVYQHKGKGLARDAFSVEEMLGLQGHVGVGHVRYPTAGANTIAEAQPFYSCGPLGFSLAHNGHITNAAALRAEVSVNCHLNTNSDTEVLLQVLAQELLQGLGPALANTSEAARPDRRGLQDITPAELFSVVGRVMARCRGGYAVTVVLNGVGLLAFRDTHGIRPLCFGSRPSQGHTDKLDWAAASESVGITGLGFSLSRDVCAGEAVFVDTHGALHSAVCAKGPLPTFTPCIFEYVYMARPDAVLDGVSVYKARVSMGTRLAAKVQRTFSMKNKEAALGFGGVVPAVDVVVPVPETSRIAAQHCARALGVPYEEGLTKNRYIGRTFLLTGQKLRQDSVKKKLSPVTAVLEGRHVLLVDDSIVRGTTSRQIVAMVRRAGATRVTFCSASPAVLYPNVYGVDLPSQEELIAHGRDMEQLARAIGADDVIYQDMACLRESVTEHNPALLRFEDSIFTGEYVSHAPPPCAFGGLEAAPAEDATRPAMEGGGTEGAVVAATLPLEDPAAKAPQAVDII